MDKQTETPGIRIPKSPRVQYLFKVIADNLENMTYEEKKDFCWTMAELVLMNIKTRPDRGQESLEEKEKE